MRLAFTSTLSWIHPHFSATIPLLLEHLFFVHAALSMLCFLSWPAAGFSGRRKADWTDSLCWPCLPCPRIKLCFCHCFRCQVCFSVLWISVGSRGVRGLWPGLWSSEQQPGASFCRPRRKKNNSDKFFAYSLLLNLISSPENSLNSMFWRLLLLVALECCGSHNLKNIKKLICHWLEEVCLSDPQKFTRK